MKALSKQPGDRYPTVKAFVDAFAEASKAPTPSGDSPEGEKAGLFGRVKGLFRRS
jgi:eukaryotic-like serine/threonine-protein kinase